MVGISYTSEVQPVLQTNTNGIPTITPARALKYRLAEGNDVRTLFISPNSYGTVNSGTQGPSSFTTRLDSLGLTFISRAYLQFLITVNGTSGNTYALNQWHSFMDHTETLYGGGGAGAQAGSGTVYHYPTELYFSALEQATSPAQFQILAQNIGVSATVSAGNFEPLYGATASGVTSGNQLLAYIPIPFEFVQGMIPVNCCNSELTFRTFWSTSVTAWTPYNTTAGLVTLSNINLYLTGVKLSERLEKLISNRLKAIPLSVPLNYWRYYYSAVTLSSGAQNMFTLLNAQGRSYILRFFLATNASDENRFTALNSLFLANGYSPAQLYSLSQGKYIMSSSSNQPTQYTSTLMAERMPYSPLSSITGLLDFSNTSDPVYLAKNGSWGAPVIINPNDVVYQFTPNASGSYTLFQLALTDGVALLDRNGSLAVTYYES